MNIDPGQIRKKLTSRTRAILPVHFAGRPCEMDAVCEIARESDLVLIEDCAHAFESQYKGTKAGTFGDFGCFSFYVTKNIVTGEGGMIITDDEFYAEKIKILALHGMSKDAWKRFGDDGFKHYQVVEAGFKYNMMDLQAAIGIHQLASVEKNWLIREKIWNRYNEAFAALPVTRPHAPAPDTRHAYHLYTLLIDARKVGMSRDDFLDLMTHMGIGVGVHYLSIPEHPFYREKFGWQIEDYPNAVRIGRETVSLPLSAKLTDDDAADVIAAVRAVCARDSTTPRTPLRTLSHLPARNFIELTHNKEQYQRKARIDGKPCRHRTMHRNRMVLLPWWRICPMPDTGPYLSVVIPVYNSAQIAPELHKRITGVLKELDADYEIIAVLDGCSDGSFDAWKDLSATDTHIKLIEFSRNFGHQVAITAGLDAAEGRLVAIMDDDLEDPPEALPAFMAKLDEGYDVVYGIRKAPKAISLLRALYSAFYRLLRQARSNRGPL